MSNANPGDSKKRLWWEVTRLQVLASVLLAMVLALIYSFVPSAQNASWPYRLLSQSIPSAIVALLALPVVYFVLYKRGLTANQQISASIEALSKLHPGLANGDRRELAGIIEQSMQTILNKTSIMEQSIRIPEIIAFHESFMDINWQKYLLNAEQCIDIVVYYFDSWVNQYSKDLLAFFKKPGTKMRVFVTNPEDRNNLANISRLFPDRDQAQLRSKVSMTGRRFAQIVSEAGAARERLSFSYLPNLLNYSAQCIDSKILVLSVFEMFRTTRIDSPAIVIDLHKAHSVRKWWEKELAGILRDAQSAKI